MPRVIGESVPETRELRWAAILDAAEQILRNGEDLTLGKVAARVGLGRTAIYRYVSGVEELIVVLATRDFPAWTAAVIGEMDRFTEPRERAVAWAMASMRHGRLTDHSWLATLGQLDLSDQARARIGGERRKVDRLLAVELEALGAAQVEVVSRAIQALIMTAIKEPATDEVDDYYAQAFGALVDAATPGSLGI